MEPVEFVGQNYQIQPPADMKDECDPLMLRRIWNESGYYEMVSCWKLDAADLEELARNGSVVYLTIVGSHPPVKLDVMRPF